MESLPVKPFQETLHQVMCGPATLKMVLDYWGTEKSEEELAKLCEVGLNGTDAEHIKAAAEQLGYKATIKNLASLDDIGSWLDKKVPVVVNWFTRGRFDYPDSAVADGHYSVVVGLDDANIYLQDPEIGGLRTIPRDDFMRVWFDFIGETVTRWEDMIVRQIIVIQPI